MPTSFAACRDEELDLVEAITPTTQSGAKFVRHQAEQDFRQWCEENPSACMRRFHVQDLYTYDRDNISGERAMYGRHEVVVAYPNDFRYGADMGHDMHDIIHEDRIKIDGAIGTEGYGNLSNHKNWVEDSDWFSVEVGEAVTFMTLTYRHFFHEDASP